ncbi:hypothetical protein TNCV_3720721 [Trichonephila clavipes]|nr:hypothetical protein TNCV_3720721 [Trichonephila clavipes]
MGHNRTTQKRSTGRRLIITELVGLGSSIHQLLQIAPMERNPMVGDLAIVAVIEQDPTYVHSRTRSMPYSANNVQKNRNAPEPNHET